MLIDLEVKKLSHLIIYGLFITCHFLECSKVTLSMFVCVDSTQK